MKKILIFLLSFLILISNNCYTNKDTYAIDTENTLYGKVLNDCILFKDMSLNENLENIYFIIPETYFVSIINDQIDNVYFVKYNNFFGYVKKSKIKIVDFIPKVKSLTNVTCDLRDDVGTQIWNIPDTKNGDILINIPAGFKGLNYIAKIYGTIPNGGDCNLWYYVIYTSQFSSTDVYSGYIYSENINNISNIEINKEDNIIKEIENNNKHENKNLILSNNFKTIIILIIAIPIIILFSIIMYILINKLRKNTKEKKNIININNEKNDGILYNSNIANHKNNIYKFKNKSFIKKIKPKIYGETKTNNYPRFPIYDSDDNLL